MKLSHILLICFLLFSSSSYATAYLPQNEIPNVVTFLPLPPSPNTKEFTNDQLQYEWGKSVRNTPRGTQAVEDASHELQYIANIFTTPANIKITPENAPQTFALLKNISDTTSLASSLSKSHYHRQRPFAYFKEFLLEFLN